MTELQPAFTYSPNGVLRILRRLPDDRPHTKNLADKYEANLAQIVDDYGPEVTDENGRAHIEIPVREIVSGAKVYVEPRIRKLLMASDYYLPSDPAAVDEVLRPTHIADRYLRVKIYPQFQRLLNKGLDEATALNALMAMADPYGARVQAREINEFHHLKQSSSVTAFGSVLELDTALNTLEVQRQSSNRASTKEVGTGNWQIITKLIGFGNAGMGVVATEKNFQYDHKHPALYNMDAYNINETHEAFSLILGLGSLAYSAAQYEGEEDIFADFEWAEA
ncbi:MAG TPA: hypothetical protein VLF79_03225 [Candidatus Saccharimonadales bacterium]|nr:hypothetical protein [Candidatus Saccharimonadales bacterium]